MSSLKTAKTAGAISDEDKAQGKKQTKQTLKRKTSAQSMTSRRPALEKKLKQKAQQSTLNMAAIKPKSPVRPNRGRSKTLRTSAKKSNGNTKSAKSDTNSCRSLRS